MLAFPYRTQAVRDLAWACFSPALLETELLADDGQHVAGCGLEFNPQRQQWLARLDRQPQALLSHLAGNKSHRLGLYFERLWHFFLQQDPAVDLVAHNLPVRDRELTLGEFDVIYRCHQRQRFFHLELAVKFFLGWRTQTTCESVSQGQEWLGPNSQDRLDLKVEQLFQRQIKLGDHPRSRELLTTLGVEELAQEIAIKGYLFQPWGDPLPAPFGFNPRLQLAQWLPLQALEHYLRQLDADYFQLLEKANWLGPQHASQLGELIDRLTLVERLQSLLANGGRARLVAAVDPAGLELGRFFVTGNDWPVSARSS